MEINDYPIDSASGKLIIPPERWQVIDAWFDGVAAKQAEYAHEIAGWIAPGFDPKREYAAVLIDRSAHRAVYVRLDGTRETKSVPDFIDDPFVPPTEEDQLMLVPRNGRAEDVVERLHSALVGVGGIIEDIWLAPDLSGVIFDLADGTTSLVPLTRFLELYDPVPS
jgi:hypothetical protein